MYIATKFQDPLINQGAWLTQSYNAYYEEKGKYHLGEDWSTAAGDDELILNVPVRAAANGKVVYAQKADVTWGNVVIIQHVLADNTVVSTLYGHLQVIDAEILKKDDVLVGQLIGTIGDANGLYDAHLHFGIYLGVLLQPEAVYATSPDPNPTSDGWVDPSSFIRNFVSPSAVPTSASVSDASITEGSNLKFTVTLDKPATAATKVYYETQLGSGATGAGKLDFAGKSGFVEIAAGKTTDTFAVGTVADKLAESTETMTVVLKSATGGVTIADGSGVGTIRDDGKGGKPDLVIQNAEISDTTLKGGDNVRLDWEIKNQGTGRAESSDVGIYLSKDSTITTSDTRLDTNSTTALAAGETDKNESDSFDLPSNLAPGTYYLGILADYQRVIDESNESNNALAFQIMVTGGGKPDLVVQNARISDTTLKAGDNVRLDWEIKNQETGQAGSSDVGIYLSRDRTITTSDTRLDTNSTAALAGGATDTNESDSFDLPSNLAPGTYYLGILADYQRVVDESNESNNSAYFGILVT
jgi:hypothetical protein